MTFAPSPHAPNYLAIANRAIWLSERREIAAQIANDRQAIMCAVEETLTGIVRGYCLTR